MVLAPTVDSSCRPFSQLLPFPVRSPGEVVAMGELLLGFHAQCVNIGQLVATAQRIRGPLSLPRVEVVEHYPREVAPAER